MKMAMILASTRRRIRLRVRRDRCEAGNFERDRRLRGKQLEHRDAGRREDATSEVVLEVEHTDIFAWFSGRQRTERAAREGYMDPRKRDSASVVENHAFPVCST